MDKVWAILLLVLGFIGIIFIFTFPRGSEKRAIQRQSKWPSTEGTVTFSEDVFKEGNATGESGIYVNIVVTKVRFSYQVGDKVYSGEQEWADSGLLREEIPKAQKYPAGTRVTVYYDIADPAQAVIERTIGASEGQGCLYDLFGAILAISTGLVLIGLLFLFIKC